MARKPRLLGLFGLYVLIGWLGFRINMWPRRRPLLDRGIFSSNIFSFFFMGLDLIALKSLTTQTSDRCSTHIALYPWEMPLKIDCCVDRHAFIAAFYASYLGQLETLCSIVDWVTENWLSWQSTSGLLASIIWRPWKHHVKILVSKVYTNWWNMRLPTWLQNLQSLGAPHCSQCTSLSLYALQKVFYCQMLPPINYCLNQVHF